MKYTKSAWFVNKFDIVNSALIGPAAIFAAIYSAIPSGDDLGVYCWYFVFALVAVKLVMDLIIVHKVWGWALLPVALVVRVLTTTLATLCGVLLLIAAAYNSQSKQKIDSAWTKDDRSSRYREGRRDRSTSEGFKSAGSGLWGFMVRHTLDFCEQD